MKVSFHEKARPVARAGFPIIGLRPMDYMASSLPE
jgi:hypothetical protein